MIQYSHNLQRAVQGVLIKYPSLLQYIRERRYRIADTEFTYKQLNVLDQAGLLVETRKSKKEWRSFDLNELLYLHIIKSAPLTNQSKSEISYLKTMFYQKTLNYLHVGDISYSEIALIALLLEVIPVGILLFSGGDAILTDDTGISFSLGYFDIKKRTSTFLMLYETFKPYLDKVNKDEAFKGKYDFTEFIDDYTSKPIPMGQRTLLATIDEGDFTDIEIKKLKDQIVVKVGRTAEGATITREDMIKLLDEKELEV